MVWRRIYANPLTEPINTVYQFTDTNMQPDLKVSDHENWHSINPQMVHFENKQKYFYKLIAFSKLFSKLFSLTT